MCVCVCACQDDKFATAGMLQISRVEYEYKKAADTGNDHEIIDVTHFVPSEPDPLPQVCDYELIMSEFRKRKTLGCWS